MCPHTHDDPLGLLELADMADVGIGAVGIGIGAVVVSDAGQVLIVKRRQEPLAGQWSLPGGMLEIGETLEAGVRRHRDETTGLAQR